jgi:RNA:NAD 2'-phosphotransferase (TPT1/KptA family)
MTRRRYYTTVDDVVAHLIEMEPGFSELDHDVLQDVVRTRKRGRYAMYQDAMLHLSVQHDEG